MGPLRDMQATDGSSVKLQQHSSVGGCLDITPLLNDDLMRLKGEDGKTNDGVEYCPYTITSKTYDSRRVNPNPDVYLGHAMLNSQPLHEQRLLDVGCGTGSFLQQMRPYFKEICGVEYNEGMLTQAVRRFGSEIELVQGAAQNLPHPDNSFDLVTINQVIHHFSTSEDFLDLQKALKECHRVLKPGGKLIICTSTPEQQRDGFWWLSLFPEASQKICDRFPPLETLLQHMAAAQLAVRAEGVQVPLHRPLMDPSLYLDGGIDLAFDAEYRKCDSSWEMVAPEELEKGLQQIQAMKDSGMADQWLQEREELRKKIGQATFVVGMKS